MNNRAQTAIYGFMLGLAILIVALAVAPALVEQTTSIMNESSTNSIGLNCTNPLISNFDKATCYAVDLSPFYFIGTVLFIAGAVVTAKIIFGGTE